MPIKPLSKAELEKRARIHDARQRAMNVPASEWRFTLPKHAGGRGGGPTKRGKSPFRNPSLRRRSGYRPHD